MKRNEPRVECKCLGFTKTQIATTIKTVMNGVVFDPFDLTIDCIGRFKRNGGDL
jgi:hypothetical protein